MEVEGHHKIIAVELLASFTNYYWQLGKISRRLRGIVRKGNTPSFCRMIKAFPVVARFLGYGFIQSRTS